MTTNGDEVNILENVLKNGFPKEFDPLLNCVNSNQDKFNLFTAITSTYWSENLHSNLIKAILDCNELGNTDVISAFLSYIDAEFNYNSDKDEVVLFREFPVKIKKVYGRVDVLLKFKNKENEKESVVIIENKINGAQETEKQIEKYLNYFEVNNISVLKVVFMPKVGYEEPETWPKNVGKDKLVVLPAYNNDKKEKSLHNFLSNYIGKFIPKSRYVIKQYIGLLKMIVDNDLSKTQKEDLKKIFNDPSQKRANLITLFEQVDKAKEEWNNRGKLIFEELQTELINNKLDFGWKSFGQYEVYCTLIPQTSNTFYFLTDRYIPSPLIEVGYYLKDGVTEDSSSNFINNLKNLAVVSDNKLEVSAKHFPNHWVYVKIPVDYYRSVEDAVESFVNIAKRLIENAV